MEFPAARWPLALVFKRDYDNLFRRIPDGFIWYLQIQKLEAISYYFLREEQVGKMDD